MISPALRDFNAGEIGFVDFILHLPCHSAGAKHEIAA